MQILAIKQKDAYKKDIRASLIYSVVSISAIKHSDPVIHIYMCVCVCMYIYVYSFLTLFSIMFYPKRLNIVLCEVILITKRQQIFTLPH